MAFLEQIKINQGKAFPQGVSKVGDNEIQIAIWQPGATVCQLRLYCDGKIQKKISMTALNDMEITDVFSIRLSGENLFFELKKIEYDFVIDGETVLDPYVQEVSGRENFGKKRSKERGRFAFHEFDWTGEKWEKISARDMILYQCHVRGFTKHASSLVKYPGTFAGMQEKIPYLKELGVNALLLLPIYEFNEWMTDRTGESINKINYWGYGKDAYYFAPKSSYAGSGKSATEELKSLIKSLHQNGMNLILDMYFEGKSPRFIVQCLQYYALEFHVDGFRLNPGSIEESWIKNDPILSHLKIFGVSWSDQSENFGQEKFMEMNDGFLIDARRYLKSDEGQTENFYCRFREQRKGVGQVHYITHNNGFTLRDLISYDVKHNEANGERNLDGTEYNYSWNCGVEGPTRRQTVLRMRRKQERNAFVMLLLGMATPMLLSGDEFGNSQKGNNNAYCQDNATTWLDWRLLEKNKESFEFVKQLIKFRKNQPLYHRSKYLTGMDGKGLGAPDVSCHGREPWVADFSYYSRDLGILYYGGYYEDSSLYFAFNFHWDSHEFHLPDVSESKEWKVLIDTAEKSEGEMKKGKYKMEPRSITVFENVCKRPKDIDRVRK